MTTYCAGFLLDTVDRVVLVRKARPEWQAGMVNGVGGHVEPGEAPAEAMRREFREEAGLDLDTWQHYATVEFPEGAVWFYRAFCEPDTLDQVRTMTDEPVEVHDWTVVAEAARRWPGAALPNLAWLLPLAAYTHDTYTPVVAQEIAP